MLVQQAHNRFDLGSWVVAVEGVAGKFVGREGGGGVGKGLSETSLAVVWWWSLRGGLVVTFFTGQIWNFPVENVLVSWLSITP